MNRKVKIAVLGAGPMGLAVAYQLAINGYKPMVFEADDRVGGMSAAFDFNGLEIERYYHFHCINDHTLLEILNELGIANKLHWVESKMGYWYQNQLQSWGNPIALLEFNGLSLLAKFRYGLHAFLNTKRNNWHSLDKITAISWIKHWVGIEAYAVLWQKLFDYKFYNYADEISAAWIWSRIRRIGRSRYDLFREKLGYLEGGSKTLLQALQLAIETNGGEIKLRSLVNKVVIENGKLQGIEINGKMEFFDKIISTIPLPYVSRLIPDLPKEVLSKFHAIKNIAVVCVIVKLNTMVTKNFWLNINDPEMDIPGIIEYSNLNPLPQHVVYVPFYMPGEHPKFQETNEVFINKVQHYLCKINPQLNAANFLDTHVHRYRYAQPVCGPGFLNTLPPIALPIVGLWVADTSYYYPDDRGMSESVDLGRKMARMATT